MILKQDLKRPPDGMCVEVIRTGEYNDGVPLARVQEIVPQIGLAECGISAKSSKAAEEEKVTTSKKGRVCF